MPESKTSQTVVVNVPVRMAYNQWTQFEEFPKFMGGVERVTQKDDKTLYFKLEIAGHVIEFDASITEQVPDQRIRWTSLTGKETGGLVEFEAVDPSKTRITLDMTYKPEGLLEGIGDLLGLVAMRTRRDLDNFKKYIEERGVESGGWRGTIHTQHVTGAVNPSEVAATGTSALYRTLHEEHIKAADMLKKLATTADSDVRKPIWDQVSLELTAHVRAEDEVVYRRLATLEGLGEKTAHTVKEHDKIEALIRQVDALQPSDPRFVEKVEALCEAVEHHVREEEHQILPMAEKQLGAVALKEMTALFHARKRELLDTLGLQRSSIGQRPLAPLADGKRDERVLTSLQGPPLHR